MVHSMALWVQGSYLSCFPISILGAGTVRSTNYILNKFFEDSMEEACKGFKIYQSMPH